MLKVVKESLKRKEKGYRFPYGTNEPLFLSTGAGNLLSFFPLFHVKCPWCGQSAENYGRHIWNAKRNKSVEKQKIGCITEYIGFAIKYVLFIGKRIAYI